MTAILATAGIAVAGDLPSRQAPPPIIGGGPGTKVGVLECRIAPSVGLLVVEFQKMNCRFSPDGGAFPEIYTGTFTTVGAAVGFTAGGALTWGVYAPTQRMVPGALAGSYNGVSASATVGIGLGSNFLLGGSQNTVALQPWSVEGLTGLSAAGGITNLQLYGS
ncbi:DUF992 domain-containing protein [Rhodoplanes sp. Z2-YC6860]|uniref:DUF992 domain-containing protein n=1 Tax=Rhodoplanes sp. Z2-YC6860 TaxID=674703 RepID=UPI000835045F|nr:DUF992 domain-containing protein [Rhodoplanes sp. Z2-YC6860]